MRVCARLGATSIISEDFVFCASLRWDFLHCNKGLAETKFLVHHLRDKLATDHFCILVLAGEVRLRRILGRKVSITPLHVPIHSPNFPTAEKHFPQELWILLTKYAFNVFQHFFMFFFFNVHRLLWSIWNRNRWCEFMQPGFCPGEVIIIISNS